MLSTSKERSNSIELWMRVAPPSPIKPSEAMAKIGLGTGWLKPSVNNPGPPPMKIMSLRGGALLTWLLV